jgi:hypothetical protein
MQTDFTCRNELGVMIGGVSFERRLCHDGLTYSNWEGAALCQSESVRALRKGLQAAWVQWGHLPQERWTDQSTAATRDRGGEERGRREFNGGDLNVMEHGGIPPRPIKRQEPHEKGDVESANGAIKRRIEPYLLLRRRRDFDSQEAYRQFVEGGFTKRRGDVASGWRKNGR